MFCPSDAIDFNTVVFSIFYPPTKMINHVRPASQRVQYLLHRNKAKVDQSLYRPGQALKVPEDLVSQISRQSAHGGGTVVSSTHRSP